MPGENEAVVRTSQKESAPLIKETGNMPDKKKNGGKPEPSTFEENVKAAYGTKPRDPKTIGSNIKLKGGKEPTETEKLTLVSSHRSPCSPPSITQSSPFVVLFLPVLFTGLSMESRMCSLFFTF
jgi:hypothetical protein